jgi:hypothetical protein
MCHFHQLSSAEKCALRDQLLGYAATVGGKNAFLKLLETIKRTSPNPLLSKSPNLHFPKGVIRWNKSIHRDTLAILSNRLNARHEENQNLMVPNTSKEYKNVTNMLRTLSPLAFTITMSSETDGAGFSFKGFEIIDDETTIINPIFELFFFCSPNVAKKLINFTDKENPREETDED